MWVDRLVGDVRVPHLETSHSFFAFIFWSLAGLCNLRPMHDAHVAWAAGEEAAVAASEAVIAAGEGGSGADWWVHHVE